MITIPPPQWSDGPRPHPPLPEEPPILRDWAIGDWVIFAGPQGIQYGWLIQSIAWNNMPGKPDGGGFLFEQWHPRRLANGTPVAGAFAYVREPARLLRWLPRGSQP
jgi:hypothetical protein